jgi:hypothetical protein
MTNRELVRAATLAVCLIVAVLISVVMPQVLSGLVRAQTSEAVVVSNSLNGSVTAFEVTPPVVLPTVATSDVPTGLLTETSAVLQGYLSDDGGEVCTIRFQYGSNAEYGLDTVWTGAQLTGDSFSQSIAGLVAGTTYHYRAQARNSIGVANGTDMTFTTVFIPPEPPSAPVAIFAVPGVNLINLSWTKGVGAEKTLVRMSTDVYPNTTTAGALVYFGVDSSCVVSNLTASTRYYVAGWSFAEGIYSEMSVNASSIPFAAALPPSGGLGIWGGLIPILGVGAVAMLWWMFKGRRKPQAYLPGPDGKKPEDKPLGTPVEKSEVVAAVAPSTKTEKKSELPTAQPGSKRKRASKPKVTSSPPSTVQCPKCQSKVVQLKPGTAKTHVCMSCGEVFDSDTGVSNA